LLACRWIERDIGVVPMEFERLLNGAAIPVRVRVEIDGLLARKRSAVEIVEGPRNAVLSDFIEAEFLRHEESGLARQKLQTEGEPLSRIFRETLVAVWGGGMG